MCKKLTVLSLAVFLLCSSALLGCSAAAVPKPHVVAFGKWTSAKWYVGPNEHKTLELRPISTPASASVASPHKTPRQYLLPQQKSQPKPLRPRPQKTSAPPASSKCPEAAALSARHTRATPSAPRCRAPTCAIPPAGTPTLRQGESPRIQIPDRHSPRQSLPPRWASASNLSAGNRTSPQRPRPVKTRVRTLHTESPAPSARTRPPAPPPAAPVPIPPARKESPAAAKAATAAERPIPEEPAAQPDSPTPPSPPESAEPHTACRRQCPLARSRHTCSKAVPRKIKVT